MSTRSLILGIALVFTLGLAALTVDVMLKGGFDILVALSLLVLGLFVFGIIGALLHPPEE
jgi:hypothetical protein